MKKIIAWISFFLGISLLGITIYLNVLQKIPTGDMLTWIILGLMFSFIGMSLTWQTKSYSKKRSLMKYFLILLAALLILTIISYYYETYFHWFYLISILFFSFVTTPLNASIRIKKWTNYVDSKLTLNLLCYADHLGIILLTLGLSWKTMHWPLANELILFGVILLIVAALSWNKIFRRQIDLRIVVENELKEKNTEIMDSIAYAKRIQSAILPPAKLVKEYLQESFILYKPKDVVSGDFYWMEQIGTKVLFAAADCTGHGVPGAMVSVVCNNALNRSVREYTLVDPGKILDKTRAIVIQEFEKSEEEVKDGMDIALCSLQGNTLKYAGAHNPLWIVRNGEVLETKANKQPIGKFDKQIPYTTHTFELLKGDSIYIFSDGYVDQFGGEKGKKFKSKAFRNLLLSIQDKTMEEQRVSIDEAFETWRGNVEQVDDVCVIGVKI